MTLQADAPYKSNGAALHTMTAERGQQVKAAATRLARLAKDKMERSQGISRRAADDAGKRLVAASRIAAAGARRSPVLTTLALVGAGIGLTMLLSSAARNWASTGAREAWAARPRR